MNRITYNNDFLQNYCKENNILLINAYNNINRDTRIEGNCLIEECKYNFNKVFRQLVKTGGYCNLCSKINHQNKIKEVVLNKYGVENVFQLNEVKDKIQKTTLLHLFSFKTPNLNEIIKLFLSDFTPFLI